MLTVLRVENLAIIDHLEVELGPGLNVITGETGAGKSILIDALGLVLGERGRPELIRTGTKQAEVEALFDLSGDSEAIARLAASGIEPESGELVVRRVIGAQGRSKAYVNGSLATLSQLADLVTGLVDISSQHEHHTLVDPSSHLFYLDAFGKLEPQRDAVTAAFAALRVADDALRAARAQIAKRDDRQDFLRFQIREIGELDPKPGEKEELEAERERLRHAEQLSSATSGAEEALYAQDGAVCERLGRIAIEIRNAARFDPKLAAIADSLELANAQVEDVARELARYARQIVVDPERLTEIDERLHRLTRLLRKYGDLEAILAHRDAASRELSQLESAEERITELESARALALSNATKAARELSHARKTIADRLAKRMGDELGSLGMGGARIVVEVAPLAEREGELVVDGARLSESGIDRVEFLIAPNKGEDARPLRKIASGGELSRAMLAIKRVLAGVGRAGLYVFDEVDSGVGGAVAEVIGRKLADVAKHHQVVCITHLAPIAVYAQRHYCVSKAVVGERTRSEIRVLDKSERLEEIARMVGGLKITERTRAAAAEMMKAARAELS